MPNGLTDSQLLDLAKTTLYNLGKPTIQNIASSLQEFEVLGRIFKDDKVMFDDGIGIQKTLMLRSEGQAVHSGRYAPDNVDVFNLLEQVKVDWVHIHQGWAWNRMELELNKGQSLVNNCAIPKRANALLNIFDAVEAGFFADPSTDPLLPKGLKYWIVKNATAGFNGGLPAGYTTVGGINISKNPNFMNYTDQYTNVTEDDLLDKMRDAAYKTNFKSPIEVADLKSVNPTKKRIYTTYPVYKKMVKLSRENNDNLGPDLNTYEGQTKFNRLEITPVHKMDELGLNDVYMINLDSFYPVVLSSSYLRESEPRFWDKNHNVLSQFIDLDYNYICLDRRANAVIDDSAT